MSAPAILVSVVVPTYRRPELLERCLEALCAQDFAPTQYEIIVADDDACHRSAHAPLERLQLRRVDGPEIRYVAVLDTQGPAGARNAGWRCARGAIVAFTDDDTIPDGHWLLEGCAALGRAPWAAAAGGRIEVPLPEFPTDWERETGGLAQAEFATANTFVRRAALERVGGFDERFTRAWREDSDLMFALMKHVGPVIAAPLARVIHPVRPAPWGVSVGQQAKVYFDALLYKKHRRLYRTRIRPVPPWNYYLAVLALLVAAVAALANGWGVATLAIAIWAMLTAAFCERRLRGASRAPSHVAEMIVTSIVIPPLALYWRWRGAFHFKVLFL